MATYARDLLIMQPIIKPIYTHLRAGFDEARLSHDRAGLLRETDPWFFLHQVRRRAIEGLRGEGLAAENEDGTRSQLPMSGILLYYQGLAIRLLHAQPHSGNPEYPSEIPSPGNSDDKQAFWRQQTTIPELQTENLLLLWLDDGVAPLERMTLVRPLGGDNRRANLRLDWTGRLMPSMTDYREVDLAILEPENEHLTLY